jgi:hypothetical protein
MASKFTAGATAWNQATRKLRVRTRASCLSSVLAARLNCILSGGDSTGLGTALDWMTTDCREIH